MFAQRSLDLYWLPGQLLTPGIFEFGDYIVDCHQFELTRGGRRVRIERKPMELLILLLTRQGSLVTRDEIAASLWPPGVFVDVNTGINTLIRKIRYALRDNAEQPRYVETVSGKGYRFVSEVLIRFPLGDFFVNDLSAATAPIESSDFVAAVDSVSEGVAIPEAPASDDPVSFETIPRNGFVESAKPDLKAAFRWRQTAALVLVSAMLSAGIALWFTNRERTLTVSRISPITTFAGDARHPSVSPDGRQVAFSWDGGSGRHIYVMLLGEQPLLRITQNAAEDDYPAWSPDGNHIAFVRRRTDSAGDIMLVSALGGPERSLHEIRFGFKVLSAHRLLAWSPDGKWLAFSSAVAASRQHGLFLLSLESGVTRFLLRARSEGENDASPAFSPDSRYLAFARFAGPDSSKLLIQRLTSDLEAQSKPTVVSNTLASPTTPVWHADSRTVLFLDYAGKRVMQARVGRPAQLVYAVSEGELEGLSYSGSGSRFICSRQAQNRAIWSLPLRGSLQPGQPVSLIRSTADDEQPAFSPDGRSVAFRSNRTGHVELWVADANGDNPRQLTHLGAYIVGFPKWSADSRHLVFHARIPSVPEIYQVEVRTGALRQITDNPQGFVTPTYSSDGEYLFAAQPGNPTRLYRINLRGKPAVALWPGSFPREAPGRNLLLYGKDEQQPGLFARSLEGDAKANPEMCLIDEHVGPFAAWPNFYPASEGVYYVSYTLSGHSKAIRFYAFASGHSVDIAPAPSNYAADIAISPDRTRMAYTTDVTGRNLVELEIH